MAQCPILTSIKKKIIEDTTAYGWFDPGREQPTLISLKEEELIEILEKRTD